MTTTPLDAESVHPRMTIDAQPALVALGTRLDQALYGVEPYMDRAEERFSVSDLAKEIQPGTVQIEHTVDIEPVMRSLINAARHQDTAESLDLKEAARTLEDYLDCRQNTALHLAKTRLKTAGTCTDVDGQDTAASRAPVYKESVGMVRNAPERSLVSEGQACRTDNDPYCHCKPIRLLGEC